MESYRLGYHLKALNNIMKRHFEKSCSITYARNITGENTFILRFLAEHDGTAIFQKDIEKRFAITRSTTSKVISLMEEKQLINRRAVSHDRRLKQIVLTDTARKLNVAIQGEIEHFESLLQKGFSTQEISTFIEYIERIKENVS